MSATVRPARPEDGPALGRMGAALVRMHHALQPQRFLAPGKDLEKGYQGWLLREAQSAEALVLVAEVAGEVVGYAYATLEGRDWMALRGPHGAFQDLWVEPSARSGGVGTLLAEALMRRLEEMGAPRVILMTASGNDAAQRLFARLGWRPTMVEMTREARGPSGS